MGHLNMTEPFEFLPNLTNVLSDFLSDRPKIGGLSTARRTARLRYSEESEVVSAGGQRVAIRIGQIGVEEEADSPCQVLPAQLPDPKRLPGGSYYRSTPFAETSVPWKVPKASSPVTR